MQLARGECDASTPARYPRGVTLVHLSGTCGATLEYVCNGGVALDAPAELDGGSFAVVFDRRRRVPMLSPELRWRVVPTQETRERRAPGEIRIGDSYSVLCNGLASLGGHIRAWPTTAGWPSPEPSALLRTSADRFVRAPFGLCASRSVSRLDAAPPGATVLVRQGGAWRPGIVAGEPLVRPAEHDTV